MFWFFGHKACGIITPRRGIQPVSPALESGVLTTGPQGKALYSPYCATQPYCASISRTFSGFQTNP